MTPELLENILSLADASKAGEGGFRDLPEKTTLTLYGAHGGTPITVESVEAVAVNGAIVRARSKSGSVYFVALEDLFAASVDGKAKGKQERRPGFA